MRQLKGILRLGVLVTLLLCIFCFSREGLTSSQHTVRLGIVTSFSTDHTAEHLEMVSSLSATGYEGELFIYFMHKAGELDKGEVPDLIRRYELRLHEISLRARIFTYEVHSDYETYCFKPSIVQDFLNHADVDVLMWSDSSTRFNGNPSNWAKNMLKDKINFVGREGAMGMSENTDPRTYKFLDVSPTKFRKRFEVQAGHWLAVINSDVFDSVLRPWMDCGIRYCQVCMSPVGSFRKLKRRQSGPPSVDYIGHRQDQAVLSILLAEWQSGGGSLHLNNDPRYIDLEVVRSYKNPF